MSSRSIGISEAIAAYLVELGHEPELLTELRAETAKLPNGGMQISPEQGQLMGWLVRLLGMKKTLEIGVFTGYSSLSVALALPADGRVVACDLSEEFTSVARRYWQRAGVAGKIELRLGPALATLERALAAGEGETYDFAFIDADKENYAAYYEHSLKLLRRGGLIAVDNALWGGSVADASKGDPNTRSIRELNRVIAVDARVDGCLLPVGDGLYLARKL